MEFTLPPGGTRPHLRRNQAREFERGCRRRPTPTPSPPVPMPMPVAERPKRSRCSTPPTRAPAVPLAATQQSAAHRRPRLAAALPAPRRAASKCRKRSGWKCFPASNRRPLRSRSLEIKQPRRCARRRILAFRLRTAGIRSTVSFRGSPPRSPPALLLIAQVVHQNREWLARPRAARTDRCARCTPRMGAPVAPPANLSAYQLRQWGVTGDPAGDGTLRVRASILNTAAQLEPYPLLRVTLANRFGGSIGTRDFEPCGIHGQADRQAARARRARRCDLGHPGSRARAPKDSKSTCACAARTERVSCADDKAPRPSEAMSVKIGPYTLPSNVLLAPMAGVTDRPFRILCRRFGAGLAASEMLSADVRLWDIAEIAPPHGSQRRTESPRGADRRLRSDDDGGCCTAQCRCRRANHRHQHGLSRKKSLQSIGGFRSAAGRGTGCTNFARGGAGRRGAGHLEDAHRLGSAPQEWRAHRKNRGGLRHSALAIHGRTRADIYQGEAEHETVARHQSAGTEFPYLPTAILILRNARRQILGDTAATAS